MLLVVNRDSMCKLDKQLWTYFVSMWRVLLTLGIACTVAGISEGVDFIQNTQNDTQTAAVEAVNTSSFNCKIYTSCTQCVSSPSPCDWCVDGHRCTHDTAENCRNDILLIGVSGVGPSYRSGPSFCPTLKSTFDDTNEILVPFGVKKSIKVKVQIIDQFIVQTRFVCQFKLEGKIIHVNAQLLADTIYCDHVEWTYTSNSPNETASFDVIWGGSKPLDNPNNIHVVIYKCNGMADDCGNCLELADKFSCGWCQGSNRCELQDQCGAQNNWLDRTQTCPKTEIDIQNPALEANNSSYAECNAYTSCTQCVNSPCDWCIDGHRCTHDTAENCRNDILVTGISRIGPSYRSGPSFCPTLKSTFDDTNEILVPFGVKKAIKVKVHIIGQFIVQTRFLCQFKLEGKIIHVTAQLLADTIYCDHVEWTYTSNSPNKTASFNVIWGGSKTLDNPNNIRVVIYKCNGMADDCGNCLELADKFSCGWCQGSNRCELQDQCGAQNNWLDRTQTCPKTEIDIQNPALEANNSSYAECNAYTSCTQCVNSPCDWCIDGHRCTHDTAENCRNDILVTGISRIGPSYRSGPSFCPTLKSTFDDTNEILVPFGVKKAIKVKVHIIGQFIVQTRFLCQFKLEGKIIHVTAQLLADTIYCDHVEWTYTSISPNKTASFDVIWGGSKTLDNPNNIHVVIYKCNGMADDCGNCLELADKFSCGWCQGSNRCELQDQCGAQNNWLDRTQTCPKTEIDIQNPALEANNSSYAECNAYTSCTQCVNSPCDWCIDGHRCTHDTAENCRNDILVTGISRIGPSYRSGPSFCPTLKSTFDDTNEILVPFGVKKAIKVKVHIIGQFIVQTRFLCQFKLEGKIIHVTAQLLADTIYCDHVEWTYTSNSPNKTASFNVIWGGSKTLDNPNNIRVVIYKCNGMADDCGNCLELADKFSCGWCQGSNRCELQDQCGAQNNWLDRTQTCPKTEIDIQNPALEANNSSYAECNAYTSCTQCVNSPCDWCIDGHRCTHDTAENCRNDILVTGISRIGPSYRSGPSFCPTLKSTFDDTNEILVPFGVKKAIKVKVHIIGQFIVQTRFLCQFKLEGKIIHVTAQLLADTIYCDHVEWTYTSISPNKTASFDVIWGGSKTLDNPNNIHVVIYKCNGMADDCGNCLELADKFSCGWCQGSNRCELQDQCGAQNNWLDRTQTCPKTEIDIQNPALEANNSSYAECNAYTSCTQCVNSPCDWCIDGHRCTHDTAENCRNDILVTGISRIGPSYRSGPSFCPTLKSTFDDTNEILVPFGVKKAIKVKVHIIGQFIVQTRFLCQFKLEGKIIHVTAQLLADTIYCDHVEWTYTSNSPNKTASFNVIWGGSKTLDNPNNIHVVIYKCNGMADDCGNCLELADKFSCGWCQGSNRCELQDQCGAQNNWLDRTQTCPKTEIDIQNPALEANNSSYAECNAYTSCTQCVNSPCDWCIDGHRCTHDTAENCRNDILVTGISRIGPSYRSGPSFCPTLKSTFDDTNEILVPFGVKKAIKVKVHIIGQFIVQTRFLCQFKLEGKIIHVTAQLLADTIYCDHVEWTYTSNSPNKTASFDVIWGGSKTLDNPNNIHVVIYKCNGMADDCGNCLELADKFSCGWCQGSNRCELQDQCGAQNNWLDRTQTCPKTEIDIQNPALEANNSSYAECNAYTSCTQCVNSPCDWCIDGHRCTHDTAENCRNDILVTGISRIGPSYRSGPSFCPTLKSTFDDTNEILVPFGVKKAIKVKVHIIGQFIVQTRFLCQFKLEGKIIHVTAQLLADTIYCDHVEWTYTSNSPNKTASFNVIWGGSKTLDNPNNIHVVIYKCNGMADDCGNCLELADKFSCGWCQGSNRCELQDQCGAQNNWLDRTQTCPKTEIDIQNPALEANNSSYAECNAYTSCTQCVNSPCDWCIDGHRCTHDTAENCRNDILVTGISRIGPSYRSGPSFCPTLKSTFDDTNEILVPFGVKKAIKVKVHIIGQFIVQTRFLCQFKLEGKIIHVTAQLLADTIYCDHVEWTYTSNSPNKTASFNVIWGGSKTLDNPNNIHVVIYKCNGMADDCGNCLELADKFSCGWCQGSNRCELQDQCGAQNNWLDRTQTCPKTEIDIQNPALEANNSSYAECNAYTSCTQCVNSPCDWCIDGHRCTHDTAENCRNDILVTSISRIGPSYRSGPSFCPTLKSTFDDTNEILVPFGVKKAIKVKVHIIGQFIVQTRFVCQFKVEDKFIYVNAQLLADTIYCDRVEWTYTSQSPNITASFDVIWGGSKPLDNPNNIHLVIYKCNGMADDCEKCLKLADRFDCGWCQGSNRCDFQNQCGAQSNWLGGNQTCPHTE